MTNDPRYPVGKFQSTNALTADERRAMIDQIAVAPVRLREAVSGLSGEQLDTPYRDGGWTVRQVIHHVPDSHLNAYIRTKLALSEDQPTIKPYDEAVWAEMEDSRSTPPEVSLTLLESLHARWVGAAAVADRRTVRPHLPASGARRAPNHRLADRAVLVAQPPSRRAHHLAPRAQRLVIRSL
jgi:hypothetical protein